MQLDDAFARYRPLIDDWEAFLDALARPLPTCVWANPLRAEPDALAALMREAGLEAEPVGWYPGAFRLAADVDPGGQIGYLAGLYQVQEEAALLPVLLLDPRPGERVLDLCAAPGNKTAQIAVRMENRGTVVANDRDGMRLRALGGIVERLGLVNVTATRADGANYPPESGHFDRVLVDVPCTCEGTYRKHPSVLHQCGPAASSGLQGAQAALLRKAVQRCRPGGRVVYATCTFAPEENEAVVDAVLREFGDELDVLPAAVPGLAADPGVTEWQGRRFDPRLGLTLRLWPHRNDTGGFFVAVLSKASVDGEREPDAAALEEGVDLSPHLALLHERFDMPPEAFEQLIGLPSGNKSIAVAPRDHRPPEMPEAIRTGLTFVHHNIRYPKLTTSAAMAFGHLARRNVVSLDAAQAAAYLDRQPVHPAPEQTAACTGKGYVLMRFRDWTLGVGFYHPEPARVDSLFPKAWQRNVE